ncbi:MAG: DUF3418 domain-containing protein, partial [Victivallales bacterium]|nr:DUF3418 domain-containing protein [Victivallales bacterium]
IFGENLQVSDFDDSRLPEYLRLKVLEVDACGATVKLHHELPKKFHNGSRLSSEVVGSKEFNTPLGDSWPGEGELPYEVELSQANQRKAFPALCEVDGKVGAVLFLKESEAKLQHQRGILQLFKLENGSQLKFMKRTIHISREMELSWFLNYRDYADDLLGRAMLEAFGRDAWEIRDSDTYNTLALNAKQNIGEIEIKLFRQLENLYTVYRQVDDLANKIKLRGNVSYIDLRRQLDFLFAPKFLRRAAVFESYSRFLRGVKLRCERILDSPSRDEAKLETLAKYLDCFYLTVESSEDISLKPEHYEFWLLLEECRLAVFTPEITPAIRSPLKQLEAISKNWKFG